jgi:hypothetical protein
MTLNYDIERQPKTTKELKFYQYIGGLCFIENSICVRQGASGKASLLCLIVIFPVRKNILQVLEHSPGINPTTVSYG